MSCTCLHGFGMGMYLGVVLAWGGHGFGMFLVWFGHVFSHGCGMLGMYFGMHAKIHGLSWLAHARIIIISIETNVFHWFSKHFRQGGQQIYKTYAYNPFFCFEKIMN